MESLMYFFNEKAYYLFNKPYITLYVQVKKYAYTVLVPDKIRLFQLRHNIGMRDNVCYGTVGR